MCFRKPLSDASTVRDGEEENPDVFFSPPVSDIESDDEDDFFDEFFVVDDDFAVLTAMDLSTVLPADAESDSDSIHSAETVVLVPRSSDEEASSLPEQLSEVDASASLADFISDLEWGHEEIFGLVISLDGALPQEGGEPDIEKVD